MYFTHCLSQSVALGTTFLQVMCLVKLCIQLCLPFKQSLNSGKRWGSLFLIPILYFVSNQLITIEKHLSNIDSFNLSCICSLTNSFINYSFIHACTHLFVHLDGNNACLPGYSNRGSVQRPAHVHFNENGVAAAAIHVCSRTVGRCGLCAHVICILYQLGHCTKNGNYK